MLQNPNHHSYSVDYFSQGNPDNRPLPQGWNQHYDSSRRCWYYVHLDSVPPRVSYTHPADEALPSGAMSPHRAATVAATGRDMYVGSNHLNTAPVTSQTAPRATLTFAQQLYASAYAGKVNKDGQVNTGENLNPTAITSITPSESLAKEAYTYSPPVITPPTAISSPPPPPPPVFPSASISPFTSPQSDPLNLSPSTQYTSSPQTPSALFAEDTCEIVTSPQESPYIPFSVSQRTIVASRELSGRPKGARAPSYGSQQHSANMKSSISSPVSPQFPQATLGSEKLHQISSREVSPALSPLAKPPTPPQTQTLSEPPSYTVEETSATLRQPTPVNAVHNPKGVLPSGALAPTPPTGSTSRPPSQMQSKTQPSIQQNSKRDSSAPSQHQSPSNIWQQSSTGSRTSSPLSSQYSQGTVSPAVSPSVTSSTSAGMRRQPTQPPSYAPQDSFVGVSEANHLLSDGAHRDFRNSPPSSPTESRALPPATNQRYSFPNPSVSSDSEYSPNTRAPEYFHQMPSLPDPYGESVRLSSPLPQPPPPPPTSQSHSHYHPIRVTTPPPPQISVTASSVTTLVSTQHPASVAPLERHTPLLNNTYGASDRSSLASTPSMSPQSHIQQRSLPISSASRPVTVQNPPNTTHHYNPHHASTLPNPHARSPSAPSSPTPPPHSKSASGQVSMPSTPSSLPLLPPPPAPYTSKGSFKTMTSKYQPMDNRMSWTVPNNVTLSSKSQTTKTGPKAVPTYNLTAYQPPSASPAVGTHTAPYGVHVTTPTQPLMSHMMVNPALPGALPQGYNINVQAGVPPTFMQPIGYTQQGPHAMQQQPLLNAQPTREQQAGGTQASGALKNAGLALGKSAGKFALSMGTNALLSSLGLSNDEDSGIVSGLVGAVSSAVSSSNGGSDPATDPASIVANLGAGAVDAFAQQQQQIQLQQMQQQMQQLQLQQQQQQIMGMGGVQQDHYALALQNMMAQQRNQQMAPTPLQQNPQQQSALSGLAQFGVGLLTNALNSDNSDTGGSFDFGSSDTGNSDSYF